MRLKIKMIFILVVLILVIIIFIVLMSNSLKNSKKLSSLNSEYLEEYRLSEKYLKKDSVTYIFTNKENIINLEEIKDIKKESADEFIEEEIITIEALYSNSLSPYPGDVSNEIVCNERFIPKFLNKTVNNLTYFYFILFSNERQSLGACSEELVKYKSLIGWNYCENTKTLNKIELFSPLDTDNEELEKIFLSFSCI